MEVAMFLAVSLCSAADAQDVGLKVMTQPWDSYTDAGEVPLVPILDDRFLTDRVVESSWGWHWTIETYLESCLSAPDAVADGVTLSNVDVTFVDPTLGVAPLSGGGDAPLLLGATVAW